MFSIVIPAHNEESVIAHCLGALTQNMQPGEAEIIVACNDGTAAIARNFPSVTVLETARQVVAVLMHGDVHAAAPLLKVDLEGRSWFLRAYYNIWTRLPYCTQGMVGSGVYALSQSGRERFIDFPVLLAEDEFIRLMFPTHERLTLPSCSFMIAAPTSFRSLLKLRERWERGNRQIDARFRQNQHNDRRDYVPFVLTLLRQPALWVDLIVYAFVLIKSRLVAAAQLRFSRDPWKWNRDDTARTELGKTQRRDS